MTVSTSSPAPSFADDRYVVLADPRPGTIVELAAGSQLAVRFRRPLGSSRWHLAEVPGHLLNLPSAGGEAHEFHFLVFDCPDGASSVRFERRNPERDIAHEVCELLVVPLNGAGARTSGSASSRTA